MHACDAQHACLTKQVSPGLPGFTNAERTHLGEHKTPQGGTSRKGDEASHAGVGRPVWLSTMQMSPMTQLFEF